MKLRIVVDVDVSKTMAETIKRNGFSVCPDGSAMQVVVPNSPVIPQRKVKIEHINSPTTSLADVVSESKS